MPSDTMETPTWIDRRVNQVYITILGTFFVCGMAWLLALTGKDATQDTKIDAHDKKIESLEKNTREDAQRTQDKLDAILREVRSRK